MSEKSSQLIAFHSFIINNLSHHNNVFLLFLFRRAAIQAISSYLEAFQKIADAATNSKGMSYCFYILFPVRDLWSRWLYSRGRRKDVESFLGKFWKINYIIVETGRRGSCKAMQGFMQNLELPKTSVDLPKTLQAFYVVTSLCSILPYFDQTRFVLNFSMFALFDFPSHFPCEAQPKPQ